MPKIEYGVELPGKRVGGRPPGEVTRWSDVAREMNSGDSVLVSTTNEARCMRQAMRAFGMELAQRSREGGYRIWCLGRNRRSGGGMK